MTRRLFSAFSSFTFFGLLSVSMTVAAETHKVRIQVPFDFQMNGVAMPAGQYIFEAIPHRGLLYLTAPDGGRHAAITMPLGNPSSSKPPQIVFERVGSRYRLAEVWLSGGGVGGGLQRTRAEKEHAARFGKGDFVAFAFKGR